MAPEAPQTASLQKNRGADTWSVMDGKSLYIKDRSLHLPLPFAFSITTILSQKKAEKNYKKYLHLYSF